MRFFYTDKSRNSKRYLFANVKSFQSRGKNVCKQMLPSNATMQLQAIATLRFKIGLPANMQLLQNFDVFQKWLAYRYITRRIFP